MTDTQPKELTPEELEMAGVSNAGSEEGNAPLDVPPGCDRPIANLGVGGGTYDSGLAGPCDFGTPGDEIPVPGPIEAAPAEPTAQPPGVLDIPPAESGEEPGLP